MCGSLLDHSTPPAKNSFSIQDHVFLGISLFNWVKKRDSCEKTFHHCLHSLTVCPKMSTLYTENNLIFN